MDRSPIFILSCARSGSTLTRLALDAHPDVACPPELHLLSLGKRLLWTCGLTVIPGHQGEDPWPRAIPLARAAVDAIMGDYLARTGKAIWAEKSVTSVNHLDVLDGLFPEARTVCLYRHAAGVVHSGLRATRDRPDGFDFESYFSREPDRATALLRYWLDKCQALRDYQDRHPGRCHVMRFEDLVGDPESELNRLADALGLPALPDWSARVFSTSHQAGPGDAHAYAARKFDSSRAHVGPLETNAVPRRLVRNVNHMLHDLGYSPLEFSA